jgi:hypothetical protein
VKPMFGETERDKARFLMEGARHANEVARFNKPEAVRLLAGYIDNDARFAENHSHLLAERTFQCLQNGAVLDLADPELRVGGEVYRPLKRV